MIRKKSIKLVFKGTGRHHVDYEEDYIETLMGEELGMQRLLPDMVRYVHGFSSPLFEFTIRISVKPLEMRCELPRQPFTGGVASMG